MITNTKVIWMTGLSGAGKSTLGAGLQKELWMENIPATLLDGDALRQGINSDLDFSRDSRRENVRRIAEIARLFLQAGIVPIIAVISPYREDRAMAGKIIGAQRMIEVYVQCPLEVCRRRDPKGLYEKVDRGLIENFTGVSAPFEVPESPDLTIDTAQSDYASALSQLKHHCVKHVGLSMEKIMQE